MAKKSAEPKASAPPQPEQTFVELMLVAADFVKNCGGMTQAQKALRDAGEFIQRAGGVDQASKALGVLESLKEKI